jgi:5-methylcytosine-specific restriction endonuclease McrA
LSKVKCRGCKTYVDKDSAIRIGLSSYCDQSCVYSAQNKKPKTKPKKVSTQHREPLSQELRDAVLTKDCFRCRLCGKSNSLAVHHIIYKSEKRNKQWQDQTSNLITLCNDPCHLKVVHGDKKRFQPLCLALVWLRETKGDRYTTLYKLEERLNEQDRS